MEDVGDAEIARLRDGRCRACRGHCTAMSTTNTGDAASPQGPVRGVKKDGLPRGEGIQKLQAHPRSSARTPFREARRGFLKKNPEGYYAKAAQALFSGKYVIIRVGPLQCRRGTL